MAVVEDRREGCDGCDRTVPLDALTTVTMPDGERLACCPQCEPHARSAAEKLASLEPQREPCDGCAETFPTSELDERVLTDGTVVSCCATCRAQAPNFGDETASAGGRGTHSDGDSASTTSTEIATRRDLCGQCHEWIEAELFRVTTTDGRTEEMCKTCKERAIDRGIVTDVTMRLAEAREILDVDPGASEAEIRQAFLQQVKHAHPDRKTGSREAFKLVKEAYDRLS